MGHCKDCSHWDEFFTQADGSAECLRMRVISSGDNISSEEESAIWYKVSDDTGLDIQLRTGPHFGCSKFEQQD